MGAISIVAKLTHWTCQSPAWPSLNMWNFLDVHDGILIFMIATQITPKLCSGSQMLHVSPKTYIPQPAQA